eukprot:7927323-Lingulodinium_polyedra.AAC.1
MPSPGFKNILPYSATIAFVSNEVDAISQQRDLERRKTAFEKQKGLYASLADYHSKAVRIVRGGLQTRKTMASAKRKRDEKNAIRELTDTAKAKAVKPS